MFEDLTVRQPDAILQQRTIKVLKLQRTRPEPGKPVSVQFVSGGMLLGIIQLPTELWLSFNKLMQKANEGNAKEGMPVALKVVVEGVEPTPEPIAKLPEPRKADVAKPAMENQEQSLPEVNEEADIKQVEEQEALLDRLSRTLKEGN